MAPPARDRRGGPRLAPGGVWAGLLVGWLLPSTGCQVEYAGMTLPSGKYMHDDVQYFAPGPGLPLGEHPGGHAAGADAGDGDRAGPPRRAAADRRPAARGRSRRCRTGWAARPTSTPAR